MYVANIIKIRNNYKSKMEQITYTKGASNEAKGSIDFMPGNGQYLAATLSASRWFKTLRGAERWMESCGYHKM